MPWGGPATVGAARGGVIGTITGPAHPDGPAGRKEGTVGPVVRAMPVPGAARAFRTTPAVRKARVVPATLLVRTVLLVRTAGTRPVPSSRTPCVPSGSEPPP